MKIKVVCIAEHDGLTQKEYALQDMQEKHPSLTGELNIVSYYGTYLRKFEQDIVGTNELIKEIPHFFTIDWEDESGKYLRSSTIEIVRTYDDIQHEYCIEITTKNSVYTLKVMRGN